ncbi:Rtr1/RPAP2 family protein [Colletotrichum scovillei]|uniref:RNA polymerase II subunit B1 CTD phosphatase RPAP2 homolog n=1 Tax=Colletotrichum scovillei TaxID=1209932 RepID=A0A9P7R2W6_9PEZI|nr:Rtr1/RPAP2 family protein [Colletotrichum scovillei]KAG7065659.1 Rtr1/RPAP2 family protein [Colletotrichum scovillei]KAG7068291.1 Rtr1/RPAP2 family protein [Colletotrichum scovillei]
MATDARPLKGILKKAAAGATASGSGAANAVLNPRKQDPREIALQHARIIQQRKDLELQILESLAELSEYPTERGSRTFSAANPSPRDVADFKAGIRLFQPSDYDDLIEERNVNGLCGYTLCAQPKPMASKGGEWRLVNFGKADFDIVNRKESEKWCSKDCQRRAMYIKVQLNESAAWERAGLPDIEIELYGEEKARQEDPASQASRDLASLKLEEGRRAADESATLALERGETRETGQPGNTFTLAIREREVKPPTEHGVFEDPDDSHLFVEGHRPGAGKAQAIAEASQFEAQRDQEMS